QPGEQRAELAGFRWPVSGGQPTQVGGDPSLDEDACAAGGFVDPVEHAGLPPCLVAEPVRDERHDSLVHGDDVAQVAAYLVVAVIGDDLGEPRGHEGLLAYSASARWYSLLLRQRARAPGRTARCLRMVRSW